jgi:F-type H+-transporting ATPase subunit gamma
MPSLKEIKGRIGSVKSTLKITSAMKLVASAKLRKAQQAIEGMRPYERKLQGMLEHLMASGARVSGEYTRVPSDEGPALKPRVALVAFASNSSLCGAFNANVVRLTLETLREYGEADVTVYSVGRKMAEAMRKVGKPSPDDYQKLSDKPAYAPAAALAEKLMEDFREGRLDRVELVYNHFVSSGKQVPVREVLLPMQIPSPASPVRNDKEVSPVIPGGATVIPSGAKESETEYILEPSAADLLQDLLPKSLKLKFFTALLDSNASEHAARTVAMQTATDNGEDLLQELTLQYNKSRQQKITSEILDLAGGTQQQ